MKLCYVHQQFFLDESGGVVPLLDIYIKSKTKAFNYRGVHETRKERKKNHQNYTSASSHDDICCLTLVFALRITKANSLTTNHENLIFFLKRFGFVHCLLEIIVTHDCLLADLK